MPWDAGSSRPCAGGCRRDPRSSTRTRCAPTTGTTRAGWTARPSRSCRSPSSIAPGVRSWPRSRCGPTGARASGAHPFGSNLIFSPSRTGRPGGSVPRTTRGRRRGRGRPGGSGRSSTYPRPTRSGSMSPPWACTRRSSTGRASATPNSRPATPSTARGSSTRRTTSPRWRGPGGTCSPCCWPTGGTAVRSGCSVRRTSTAATWRCAPSSRCGPGRAGRSRRPASRAGASRRPTSPRPTSSAASARTTGGSPAPCTTCHSTTERGARLFPATSTSPSCGRSLPRCAGCRS
jgi:hypothetical protein